MLMAIRAGVYPRVAARAAAAWEAREEKKDTLRPLSSELCMFLGCILTNILS